jgi:flagellar biosynthesis protein FlhB
MFSHDDADRALPPTERHRRQAKARGLIPRSAELTAAATLFLASCYIFWTAPEWANTLAGLMKKTLSSQPRTSMNIAFGVELLQTTSRNLVSILWPVFLVLVIGGLTANLIQTGWLWIPSMASPRFRPNSIVSRNKLAESLARLIRLGILAVVTYRFFAHHQWHFRSIASTETFSMMTLTENLVTDLCIQLSLCLLIFAFVDYGVRYWQNEQSLKMTIEERRREHREEEIDSRFKHRKPIHLEIESVGSARS